MKCETCGGLGYQEYEAGLVQAPCRICNSTGEVPDIEVGKGNIIAPFGDVDDNRSDSRAGPDNQLAGSGDTGKYKQPKKRKARKKAAKRAG